MPTRSSLFLGIAFFSSALADAQSTQCISVDRSGGPANGGSGASSISGDGRFVGMTSFASNLVPNDTNGAGDAFVRDLAAGVTERVSVSSAGVEGNAGSGFPVVSADGRYVAFTSIADNLVPGDANAWIDVFLRDRLNGTTERLSVNSSGAQGDGPSATISMSADGRYVAFQSFASNLIPLDTNGSPDVFVHDRSAGVTRRVSVDSAGAQANGASIGPFLSGDGRFVTFGSAATNLVANDTNGKNDIFVRDLVAGTTVRVSVDSSGAEANATSIFSSLSFDGSVVAFHSDASNLVAGDTNAASDTFVHVMASGVTERVSIASDGQQQNAATQLETMSMSADGRYVEFSSHATNLVPNDHNGKSDVFLHDRWTGLTTRENVSTSGAEANGVTQVASLSADARFLVFTSFATNLAPNYLPDDDAFLRDRGASVAFAAFCSGDGGVASCPCANAGAPGHGCASSSASQGAILAASGAPRLSSDTVLLMSSSEPSSALSVVLQGSTVVAPAVFGGGLRCAGGALLRLYVKNASAGTVSAPQGSEPSISARSAALGDSITLGSSRVYQVYYRDPNLAFCPAGFNASNAIVIAWGA